MAGGAKSKGGSKSKGGGGSKLPSNQSTLGAWGFGPPAAKPRPKPKPSGDESGKTSSSNAAAAERSGAAAAPPDTPGTEPCSPETPAVGASIKKKEDINGAKNNKSPADVPVAISKPSSSSDLQDDDDDDNYADADADTMQTPVNKTAFKRPGSGGGSSKKRSGKSKKGSGGGKRLVIDDSDDTDTGDDDDANNRIPKEYNRNPTKFIDRRVAKVFNNETDDKPEIFLGRVTDYTTAADSENDKPFWHVLFDDGDEEDWHWEDLDHALSLYRRKGHQLDDTVPGKRKIINASEDEGEDAATDNDDDAYRPTDDATSSMEDASSSDLEEAATKKPARKKVKTARSPSRSKSTDAITAATSSAATDTTASLPSAKRKPKNLRTHLSAPRRKGTDISLAVLGNVGAKKGRIGGIRIILLIGTCLMDEICLPAVRRSAIEDAIHRDGLQHLIDPRSVRVGLRRHGLAVQVGDVVRVEVARGADSDGPGPVSVGAGGVVVRHGGQEQAGLVRHEGRVPLRGGVCSWKRKGVGGRAGIGARGGLVGGEGFHHVGEDGLVDGGERNGPCQSTGRKDQPEH